MMKHGTELILRKKMLIQKIFHRHCKLMSRYKILHHSSDLKSRKKMFIAAVIDTKEENVSSQWKIDIEVENVPLW